MRKKKNISQKIIAFIGYRPNAIKAAKKLGYRCIIWSNKTIAIKTSSSILGIDISPFPATKLNLKIKKFLNQFNIACVIPLTEASVVACALVDKYLKLDSSTQTMRACQDKWLMKKTASKSDILVTDCSLIKKNTNFIKLEQKLGFPIYLKLRKSSGGRGQTIIHNSQDLKKFARHNLLAEKYIQGREMSVEVLVQNKKILFINQTEYYRLREANIIPATEKIPEKELLSVIKKIIKGFKIHTCMLHIELFRTLNGLVLGELAVRPPGGYIMDLIKLSYEFDPWEALIKIYLKKKLIFPQAKACSAAYILHPGAGKITAITKTEVITKLASFYSLKIKKKIGDFVSTREGAGQDIGHIIFRHQDPKQIIQDLEFSLKRFIIAV